MTSLADIADLRPIEREISLAARDLAARGIHPTLSALRTTTGRSESTLTKIRARLRMLGLWPWEDGISNSSGLAARLGIRLSEDDLELLISLAAEYPEPDYPDAWVAGEFTARTGESIASEAVAHCRPGGRFGKPYARGERPPTPEEITARCLTERENRDDRDPGVAWLPRRIYRLGGTGHRRKGFNVK